MKKITIITAIVISGAVAFTGCDSKREPGKVYMPDMAYSRAVESYSEHDAVFTRDIDARGGDLIFYNAMPVNGTMRRGEIDPFPITKDTANYKLSASVKNPFDSVSKDQMAEAGRLFNINCAVCHGATGTANGPIADKIGGVANLTDATRMALSDGELFYTMTYGKGAMGSYASQLTRTQRWMIVKYIRTLQPKAGGATGAATTDTAAAKKPM